MKSLFVLGLVLGSLVSSVQAHAWEKFVDCNNGALVLDYAFLDGGKAEYQMVMRYSPLGYFVKMNAINASKVNAKNEFVIPMRLTQGSFKGMQGSDNGRERTVIYATVDHMRKNVHVTVERSGISSPSVFQRTHFEFLNCFTKL